MAFPTSPTDGQMYKKFRYDSVKGAWTDEPLRVAITNDMLSGDTTINTSYQPYYTVIDQMVFLNGYFVQTTLGEVMMVFPEHLRPVHAYTTVCQSSGSNTVKVTINALGELNWNLINNEDTTAPGGVYLQNVCWPIGG